MCGTRIPGTSQQVKGRCPNIPLPSFSSYFKGLYKELIFDRSHEMIDISLSLVGLKSKEKLFKLTNEAIKKVKFISFSNLDTEREHKV